MDYAGEELLRQRRVLAKLLLGAGESAVKGNGEDKTQAVTTLDMGDPEGETAAVGLISVFEDPGNSMDGGVLPAAAPPGGGSREYKGEAGVRRPAAEGLLARGGGRSPLGTEGWRDGRCGGDLAGGYGGSPSGGRRTLRPGRHRLAGAGVGEEPDSGLAWGRNRLGAPGGALAGGERFRSGGDVPGVSAGRPPV